MKVGLNRTHKSTLLRSKRLTVTHTQTLKMTEEILAVKFR